MTEVLVLVRHPRALAIPYYEGIKAAFPDLAVNFANNVDEAAPFLATAEVLVAMGPHVTDEAYKAARNLKWVQLLGTGVDSVINRPAIPPSVVVTNVHGIHAESVSEAAILFMLALSRDLPRAVRNMDSRRWEQWSSPLLVGKTVGIFGVGLIAEGLAPRCKAMGMTVLGITSAPRAVAGFDRMHHRDALLSVVPELDYLVLLTPLTDETRHIIGEAVLAAMKPTSRLINLARGGLVDEAALVRALASGRIAGAATDVAANEPPGPDDPLWSAPNLIVTGHVSAMHDDYQAQAIAIVNENMRRFLAGDAARMINLVRR